MLFEAALEDWLDVATAGRKPGYAADMRERLAFNTAALVGRPLHTITRKDVIAVIEAIAARGSHEQARRVRALLARFFEWAAIGELITDNPAPRALLQRLPAKPPVTHHAAAAFGEMPAVYRRIAAYPSPVTSAALRFLILTAARTSEVLGAEWDEVNLGAAVWTVPAERMKAGRPHRVPLSSQAVALLRGVPRLSDRLLFPTLRRDRPMSGNALGYALKGMGFEFTVHGFRSTFSTWANDTRAADPDIVEAALAHIVPGVRGAYDRGDRFDARRALMQTWSDALTSPSNPTPAT